MTAGTDRAEWHRHFAEIIISGDESEVGAAVDAALAAAASGADHRTANAAGKAAAKRYRTGDARVPTDPSRQAGRARVWMPDAGGRDLAWPRRLATQLFGMPQRWGWQAAPVPVPPPQRDELAPAPRPAWVAPPRPDTSALRTARRSAVTSLIAAIVLAVLAFVAYGAFRFKLGSLVDGLGPEASQVYRVALVLGSIVVGVNVVRAAARVLKALRDLRDFERPYLAMVATDRQRHREALRAWEEAVRRFHAEATEADRAATRHATGPRWFPVLPAAEPTRVDVVGGDPRRHGWASLLVTMGASVLAAGHPVTVLDFTGQDVGGGLASVAAAGNRPARLIDFAGAGANLLAGIARSELPDCLARAVTDGADGTERRQERALIAEVLGLVLGCLAGEPTFARLAAGVRVLRQGTATGLLTDTELSDLAAAVSELDQNEWTARQLRFLASNLDMLHGYCTADPTPLWGHRPVTLIVTPGGRDDRKELLDRVLVQLARHAMDRSALRGVLVVAGADRLGAEPLAVLSDQARRCGALLVSMIDQPRDDLEKIVGTGGAVCVMKMYNHRDANVAAEFVGRGYRFVVNQVTRQVGRSFTDSGGDSFAANTGAGSGTHHKKSGGIAGTDVSDSRGHAWTGTRGWQSGDNIGVSTASSRVYEFVVEPQEVLGMPETAFLLVDSSGAGRKVVMADCNPGISLLDGVATVPIDQVAG